ncbi:hypothetical protein [Lentzea albidocapillata]|nr:hypothetical protein [Lentzea albidocapillata]
MTLLEEASLEKVGGADACVFPVGKFTPVAQKVADEVRKAIG